MGTVTVSYTRMIKKLLKPPNFATKQIPWSYNKIICFLTPLNISVMVEYLILVDVNI